MKAGNKSKRAKGKAGSGEMIWNAGLSDPNSPEFSLYTHIYLPYCTGDLHWGDADVTYEPGLTVRHRGGENARVAIQWMVRNFAEPEQLFVTGCSAGSYASIFWGAKIAEMYEGKPCV